MDASDGVTGDVTRCTSGLSAESEVDIVLPDVPPGEGDPDKGPDDGLSEGESFMTLTQEETSAWEEMIKTLQGELATRGQEFSQWTDKITRRRMFAYTRMRKLEKCHLVRREFYGNVDEFIEKYNGDMLKLGAGILLNDITESVNCDAQTDESGVDFRTNSANMLVPMNSPEKQLDKDGLTPIISEEPTQVAAV